MLSHKKAPRTGALFLTFGVFALVSGGRQRRSQGLFGNLAQFLRKCAHVHGVGHTVGENLAYVFNLGRCDNKYFAGYI